MNLKSKFTTKNVLTISGIYVLILLCLEFAGHFTIKYIESRRPSGIYAENIMSLHEPVLDFALKKKVDENFPGWNVKTNVLGYRIGQDFELEKPKDTLRIVLMGGSTIFGWGVGSEDSIPVLLQKLITDEIAKSGRSIANLPKKVEVINAGVPWYTTWNEAALTVHRVMMLKPDWVIAFDGLNDAAKSLAPEWKPIYKGYEDVATTLVRERLEHKVTLKDFLLEVANLSPTVRYLYAKLHAKKEMQMGAYHPEVWDQYVYYHEIVKALCDGKGVRYSAFLQPVMMVHKPLHEQELKTNFTSMRDDKIAQTFKKVYLIGEAALEKASFKITNLAAVFENTKDVIYLDGLHYNRLGNMMLAEAIFNNEVKPKLSTMMNAGL